MDGNTDTMWQTAWRDRHATWLRWAMGRHGRFENFGIGPSFSNRIEMAASNRIESRSFTGPSDFPNL